MRVNLAYCERCGARLVTMELAGRPRDVCSECGRVAYRNPLPVAAAVVLNDAREVLLVRRRYEPHAGMWCLPTGFAEVDETIDEAALRELREETGLEGRIHRLLTAHSLSDEFYGELLFVCFEVERVAGGETPGDDAEALAYFPIDDLPPLAFDAHTEAVEVCSALHREPWAIQDSFTRLYSDSEEGLLSDPLVTLVEQHADEICDRWLEAVRHDPSTTSYARPGLEGIRDAAYEALSQFCSWLPDKAQGDAVEAFYLEVGRRRAEQGVALADLISALTLLRREIWAFAREHEVLADPLGVYRVLELSRRIALYFDKALFHATRGYLGTAGAP
jgi:ADP-ribose pyrophosphatase YjhB (NUDIX family)